MTRRVFRALSAVSLVLTLVPIDGPASAQTPPPPADAGALLALPAPPNLVEQNVRVDVTITLKGAKPVTKSLSMVAASGRPAKGQTSIEVPVSSGTVPASFNYRSVGIGVDAVPTIGASGKVLVRLKMNFQTVYLPEGPETQRASFGSGSTDVVAIVFESGKPLVVAQSSDGESGREYSVEVKATILK